MYQPPGLTAKRLSTSVSALISQYARVGRFEMAVMPRAFQVSGIRADLQGSGVFRTYPVLRSMRWQGGIAQVVGTGMPR